MLLTLNTPIKTFVSLRPLIIQSSEPSESTAPALRPPAQREVGIEGESKSARLVADRKPASWSTRTFRMMPILRAILGRWYAFYHRIEVGVSSRFPDVGRVLVGCGLR